MDIKPISPQNEKPNAGSGSTPSPTPPTGNAKSSSTQLAQPQAQAATTHATHQADQVAQAPVITPSSDQNLPPAQAQSPPSLGDNNLPPESPQPFVMQDNSEPEAGQAQAVSSQDQSGGRVYPEPGTPGPQPFSMDNGTPHSADNATQNTSPQSSQSDQTDSNTNTSGIQPASVSGSADTTFHSDIAAAASSTSPQTEAQAPALTIIDPQQQHATTTQQPLPTSVQAQQQVDASAGQSTAPPQAQPEFSPSVQAQPSQPTITPSNGGDTSSTGKKKKLGLIVGAAVGIVAILSGVVFGYAIPNRPENVFSTGLDRSGQAINGLMVQLAEMETADQMNQMQATADMQIEMEGTTFEGDVRVRFDETASESTFSLQAAGDASFELSGDVLTTNSDQSDYPDVYLQLTGITALGLDAFIPGISRYDGRWIHMPSAFLEEAIGPIEQTEVTQEMPDSQDIMSLMVDISEVVRDYLLTSDEEKSVFEIAEIVGEEDVDGKSAYRYKVAVEEQNFELFCVALAEKIEASDYYSVISDTAFTEPLDTSGCAEAAEEINEETIDIWVDRRTKLISKIRFTNPEVEQEYSELGLNYEGGDDVGLYLRDISEDQTVELSMQTNFESLRTTGAVVVEQNGLSGFEFTMNVSAEPYQDAIEATPPETAVTFEQMFEDLLGSSGGFTLGRQTDDDATLPLDSGIVNSEDTTAAPEPSGQTTIPVQLPSFRDVVRSYNNPPSTETLE